MKKNALFRKFIHLLNEIASADEQRSEEKRVKKMKIMSENCERTRARTKCQNTNVESLSIQKE